MKKIIFLAYILVIGALSVNAQILKGDMNDDNKIDVSDLNEAINTMLGLSSYQYINAGGGDPYLVDNSRVVGTWYKSKSSHFTLNADGTTDYSGASTYKFLPYQGALIFYDNNGTPVTQITVDVLKDGYMVCVPLGTGVLTVLTTTQPTQLVTSINLMPSSMELWPGQEQTLLATVLPFTADNRTVTYESSDESVVRMQGRTAVAVGTAIITCSATDGSGVTATCTVTVSPKDLSGTDANGREYVDLDLPSGTLWAAWNVGASNSEELGQYFAWGETLGYSKNQTHSFNADNYKFYNNKYKFTKYCLLSNLWDTSLGATPDGKTELDPEDDAATVNWGSEWCMPTKEQAEELSNTNYTTRTTITINGQEYIKITSKSNGKFITIPMTRTWQNNVCSWDGTGNGRYWTRTLFAGDNEFIGTDSGHYFFVDNKKSFSVGFYNRIYGNCVRAVRVAQ